MEKKNLTGTERVATFLLSLEKDLAAQLLRTLEDNVISDVADAMTRLDPSVATQELVNEIYKEVIETVGAPSPVKPKDEEELQQFLAEAIGEQRGGRVIDRLQTRRRLERPFFELEQYPPDAVARVLKTESPAVAALVLSHMDPSLSAGVLQSYDPDTALDVVRRMSSLSPPGLSTLQAIAADIQEQLETATDARSGADPTKRLQTIAEMLNYTGEEIERAVLTGLDSELPEVAHEVREFMFTWTDLSSVDKRAMQKILGSVNTKTLSIALKACTPDVEENVLSNLSSRVRDMVQEERELAGPTPMSEVQACRDEIMMAVRALMDSGEFRPTRAGEDIVN